jgi:hypothetical protein
MRLVLRAALIVLIAGGVLAYVGFGLVSPSIWLFGPSELRIPTHTDVISATDRLTGTLIQRGPCLLIVGGEHDPVQPIWPAGYTYRYWERGGELDDPAGANVIVHSEIITLIGERIRWDGAPPPSTEGLSPECPFLDLWAVAEVEVPPQ